LSLVTYRAKALFKLVKLTTFAAVALSFFGFSFANADPNQVYLENGGYIHFEVEDADPAGQWSLRNEIEGFTGTGYFEWTGPNHFLQANAGNGTITYHFRIETAGNYELRWRSRIAKGDENTESNDSWVRFNTGINVTDEEPLSGWTKVFMGESNIWTWSARTSDHGSRRVRQYFSQGDHTLQISGRSNGHAIDKIALYRYGDVNFDAGLNGVLPLSQFIRLDGTLVDPNAAIANSVEPVDPVTGTAPETENSNAGSTPETDNPNGESAPGTENTSGSSVPESVNSTGDSTPDTENTIATPEPDTTLSEQLNVQPLAEEFEQLDTAVCQVNTVTLLPSKYALLNLGEQSFVTDITDLQLIPDTQSLLLSYDLSQLPVFSAAQIQYQTGSNISNGALSVHLGSHNNWTDTSTEDFPVAIVNTCPATEPH